MRVVVQCCCYVLQAVYVCALRLLDSASMLRLAAIDNSGEWQFLLPGMLERRLYALLKRCFVAREAESVPKIGGGVPRRLLCPSDEASAKDDWLNSASSAPWVELSEGHFGTVHQPRGAVIVHHISTARAANHSTRGVSFIGIEQ